MPHGIGCQKSAVHVDTSWRPSYRNGGLANGATVFCASTTVVVRQKVTSASYEYTVLRRLGSCSAG